MTPGSNKCGDCQLCCRLMGVADLKPDPKPKGSWCDLCKVGPGGGCRIYAARPPSCVTYRCLWLDSQINPDVPRPIPSRLRPDQVGFLLNPLENDAGIAVMVDPERPDAWREGEGKYWLGVFAQHVPVVVQDPRTGTYWCIEKDGSLTELYVEVSSADTSMLKRKGT